MQRVFEILLRQLLSPLSLKSLMLLQTFPLEREGMVKIEVKSRFRVLLPGYTISHEQIDASAQRQDAERLCQPLIFL